MPYTTIDKSSDHFQTETWSSQDTSIDTINFAPDWVWIKSRTNADTQILFDSVRGANKRLSSSGNTGESTTSDELTAFNSDGYTLGTGSNVNRSGHDYVSWNWLAGGTAPAITYSVKVVSDSGNKYRFDDFGTSAVTLDLQEGGTYTFDQSDSSNSGHPLRFSTTSDGSHGGGSEYTTGVTTTGTPGSAGAKTVITVGSGVATLYYYCTQHSGMGGQANTNSTHGSSNFSGSIQSTVSANITAGFSVVKYDGNNNGTTTTIGHGLNGVLDAYIVKSLDSVGNWQTYHHKMSSDPKTDYIQLDSTGGVSDYTFWGDTAPTSSVFTVKDGNDVNENGEEFISYCFKGIKGYSKFGKFTANGNDSNAYVFCGFTPRWVMIKPLVSDGWSNWYIFDTKRDHPQLNENPLFANLNTRENYYGGSPASNYDQIDILSNGFKVRRDGNWGVGGNGQESIFFAFAEFPFVSSTGIPACAK